MNSSQTICLAKSYSNSSSQDTDHILCVTTQCNDSFRDNKRLVFHDQHVWKIRHYLGPKTRPRCQEGAKTQLFVSVLPGWLDLGLVGAGISDTNLYVNTHNLGIQTMLAQISLLACRTENPWLSWIALNGVKSSIEWVRGFQGCLYGRHCIILTWRWKTDILHILRFILPCQSDCYPIFGIFQLVTQFTHV